MYANAKSWIWTVAPTCGVRPRMDDDTLNLIHQLCTRAGMIMEDVSMDALLIPERSAGAVSEKLVRLGSAAEAIRALITAASALSRES
jgi:hypothetical protein